MPYDVLDIEAKQFDDDFYEFRCQIKELERRLGSVLNQGFEDCATVFAAFKLIESFEGLLEREFIQADLERKHLELIKAYGSDLKDVQDTFTRQKTCSAEGFYLEREGPPLYMNLPPISGALFWANGLLDRIEEPMVPANPLWPLMHIYLCSANAQSLLRRGWNLVNLTATSDGTGEAEAHDEAHA